MLVEHRAISLSNNPPTYSRVYKRLVNTQPRASLRSSEDKRLANRKTIRNPNEWFRETSLIRYIDDWDDEFYLLLFFFENTRVGFDMEESYIGGK